MLTRFVAYTILLFAITNNGYAQTIGDKDYYLIDGLVLQELSMSDSALLDSCLGIYHDAKVEIDRIDALLYITENLDHHKWVDYNDFVGFKILSELSQNEIADSTLRFYKVAYAGVLNNQGVNSINRGNLDSAANFFKQSLEIDYELDRKNGAAYALLNLGYVYENQGQISKGLDYYLEALNIITEVQDTQGLIACYNNIGYLYDIQEEFEMALEAYEKSLKYSKANNYVPGISNALNNIGSAYERSGNLKKGITYCEEALEIRRKSKNLEGVAQSLNNIGSQYEKLHVFDKRTDDSLILVALAYYHESHFLNIPYISMSS